MLTFGLLVLFLSTAVLLARTFRNFHSWALVIVVVVPVVSFVGCVFGLVGLRRPKHRHAAVIGTILNSAVLLSSIVAYLWS